MAELNYSHDLSPRTFRVLTGLRMLSFVVAMSFAFPAGGNTPQDACQDIESQPEDYLVGVDDLPLETLEAPVAAARLTVEIPDLWRYENLLCLFFFLATGAAGFIAFKADARVAATVCVLGVIFFGGLGLENFADGRAISRQSRLASEFFSKRSYDKVHHHLLAIGEIQQRQILWHLVPLYRSAIEQLDLSAAREVNGVAAIYQAIGRRNPEGVERGVTFFAQDTLKAIKAKVSGLSHKSNWLLEQQDFPGCLDAAERAYKFPNWRSITQPNLCAARYHRGREAIAQGEIGAAIQMVEGMEPPACNIAPGLRIVLRGLLARTSSQSLDLVNLPKAATEEAVRLHQEAFEYSHAQEMVFPFIDCEYVISLEAHALASLAREEPMAAVLALDEAEMVISGRPVVRAVLPAGLYGLGLDHLRNERFEEAITAMKRGYELAGQRELRLEQGLSLAHLLYGSRQLKDGEIDLGIESLENAYRITPREARVHEALADALLYRGDEFLRKGELGKAGPDFKRAAAISPTRNKTARMRLQLIKDSPSMLAALNNKPNWYGLPPMVGIVPKDHDYSGIAQGFVFYGQNSTQPVGIGMYTSEQMEPRELHILNEQGKSTAVLLDSDSNGWLDNRSDYENGQIYRLMIDVDDDRLPDFRISFEDGSEKASEILSGTIVISMLGGVITDDFIDPLSYPDIYFKAFQNGALRFQSDTIRENAQPEWGALVTIDYRFGDRVRFEIWDEDLIHDDFVDRLNLRNFPEAGVYPLEGRRAAVRIQVEPPRLPPDYQVRLPQPEMMSRFIQENKTIGAEYEDLFAAIQTDGSNTETKDLISGRLEKLVRADTLLTPLYRTSLASAWRQFCETPE